VAQWKKEALKHKGKVKDIPGKVLAQDLEGLSPDTFWAPPPPPAVSTKPKKVAKAAEKAAAKKAEEAKSVAKFKEDLAKNMKAGGLYQQVAVDLAMGLQTSEISDGGNWAKDMEKLQQAAKKMAASMAQVSDAAKELGKSFAKPFKPGTKVMATMLDAAGEPVEVVEVPLKEDGTIAVPDNPHGGSISLNYEWGPPHNHYIAPAKPKEGPTGAEITFGGKVQAPPEDWVQPAPEKPKVPTAEELGVADITMKVTDYLALDPADGLMSPKLSDEFIKQLMDSPSLVDHIASKSTNKLAKKLKFGPGKMFKVHGDGEKNTLMGEVTDFTLELAKDAPGPLLDKVGNEPEPQENAYYNVKGTDLIPEGYFTPEGIMVYHDTVHFYGKAFHLNYMTPKGDLHIQFSNGYNLLVPVGNHTMTKVTWMFQQVLKELDATSPNWKVWTDDVLGSQLQLLFHKQVWYKPKPLSHTYSAPGYGTYVAPPIPTLEMDYDYPKMLYSFAVQASDKTVYIGKVDHHTMLQNKHLAALLKIGYSHFEGAMVNTFNDMVAHIPDWQHATAKDLFECFCKLVLKT
jgi:hypothetical protein